MEKRVLLIISIVFLLLELSIILSPIYLNMNMIYISGWQRYSISMDHLPNLISWLYENPTKDMIHCLIIAPVELFFKGEILQEPTFPKDILTDEILSTQPELQVFNSNKLTREDFAQMRFSDLNLLFLIYSGAISFLIRSPVAKMNLYFIISTLFMAFVSFYLLFKESKSLMLSLIVSNTLIFSNTLFFQFTVGHLNLCLFFPSLIILYLIYRIKYSRDVKKYYLWIGFWLGIQTLSSIQIALILLYLILIKEFVSLIIKKRSLFHVLKWKKIIPAVFIFVIIAAPRFVLIGLQLILNIRLSLFALGDFVSNVGEPSIRFVSELFSYSYPHSISFSGWIISALIMIYSLLKKRWHYLVLIILIVLFSFGFAKWNTIYKLFSYLPFFAFFRVTKRFLIFIPLFNFIELIEIIKEESLSTKRETLLTRVFASQKLKIILFIVLLSLDILYIALSPFIFGFHLFDPFI